MNRVISRAEDTTQEDAALLELQREVYYLNQRAKSLLEDVNNLARQIGAIEGQKESDNIKKAERNLNIINSALNSLLSYKSLIQSINIDRARLLDTTVNFGRNRNISAMFQDVKQNLTATDKALNIAVTNGSKLQQELYDTVKALKEKKEEVDKVKNEARKQAIRATGAAVRTFVMANLGPIALVLLVLVFLIVVIVAFVNQPPPDALLTCGVGDSAGCIKTFQNSAIQRLNGQTEDSKTNSGECNNSLDNACPDEV